MTLFSNKNIEKYFLTKKSIIKTNAKVNLVLSPEFYWVRIFDIPVDNEKKVFALLPSIFEDILPSGDFDYSVSKLTENRFLCYAFDNAVILESIKRSGLNTSQVNSVYFAQTQMNDYECFMVDDCTFMYDKEILIKVPQSLGLTAVKLSSNLEQIKYNNHKINMKFYSNVINSKYIYTLIFLLSSVCLLNAVKYFDYSNEIKQLESKVQTIKNSNNMPKTTLQTVSILKNMKIEVERNREFRESLSYILEFKKRVKKGTLEKISYKNDRILIVFKDVDWNNIKRYLEKKYSILSHSNTNDLLNIEVKI